MSFVVSRHTTANICCSVFKYMAFFVVCYHTIYTSPWILPPLHSMVQMCYCVYSAIQSRPSHLPRRTLTWLWFKRYSIKFWHPDAGVVKLPNDPSSSDELTFTSWRHWSGSCDLNQFPIATPDHVPTTQIKWYNTTCRSSLSETKPLSIRLSLCPNHEPCWWTVACIFA